MSNMSQNIPSVNHTQLSQLLDLCILTDEPLMLWGEPGIGKSEAVEQAAERAGALLVDVRLSLYESVDLRGLPDVDNDATVWRVPNSLPFEGATGWPTDRPIILFLDELMLAAGSVLSAAFQLILNRALGEHKLMPNVRIVGASNEETHRAGVGKMPTPLANRFMHARITPCINAFMTYGYKHDLSDTVLGFLKRYPQHLSEFENALKTGAKAFATPRAWTKVSRMLNAVASDQSLSDLTVASIIGESVSAAFNAFIQLHDLCPSPEDIEQDPEGTKVPERADVMFMTITMLVKRVSEKNVDKFITYAERLPLEYRTMFAVDIGANKSILLVSSEKMSSFVSKNHKELNS